MNWIKKTLSFGEKIKRIIKKRASKEDIANSDWTVVNTANSYWECENFK